MGEESSNPCLKEWNIKANWQKTRDTYAVDVIGLRVGQ